MSDIRVTPSGTVHHADACNCDSPPKCRPVVVIDPEDREQVKRLADAYWATVDEEAHASMEEALRSLIAPPRPEEPTGLGAVVEDAEGRKWVRCEHIPDDAARPWHGEDEMARAYSDFQAVRVLSAGWSE